MIHIRFMAYGMVLLIATMLLTELDYMPVLVPPLYGAVIGFVFMMASFPVKDMGE